jgi:hypothetical protein
MLIIEREDIPNLCNANLLGIPHPRIKLSKKSLYILSQPSGMHWMTQNFNAVEQIIRLASKSVIISLNSIKRNNNVREAKSTNIIVVHICSNINHKFSLVQCPGFPLLTLDHPPMAHVHIEQYVVFFFCKITKHTYCKI